MTKRGLLLLLAAALLAAGGCAAREGGSGKGPMRSRWSGRPFRD